MPPDAIWSEWGDLNSRPLGPEPSALPTALYPEIKWQHQPLLPHFLVAEEGFEPSQTESESVVLPLHNPAIWRLSVADKKYYIEKSV